MMAFLFRVRRALFALFFLRSLSDNILANADFSGPSAAPSAVGNQEQRERAAGTHRHKSDVLAGNKNEDRDGATALEMNRNSALSENSSLHEMNETIGREELLVLQGC
ncbi:unnamed protein product [Amoebophrya sp. A120]|nr:unnamed protein product [Amoebophrya sp. A120]|eukprot:GSA120T00023197001.1